MLIFFGGYHHRIDKEVLKRGSANLLGERLAGNWQISSSEGGLRNESDARMRMASLRPAGTRPRSHQTISTKWQQGGTSASTRRHMLERLRAMNAQRSQGGSQ